MADNPNLREQLRRLHESFGGQLRNRLDAIVAEAKRWVADGHLSTDLDPLCLLLHNLTGAAGTFGYERLSDASRNLENQFRRLRDRGAVLSREEVDAVLGKIDGLSELANFPDHA